MNGFGSIINNKVGYLIALAAKERQEVETVGTFDFIVDMFDRDDADDLGNYWSNNVGFAIRDGVCVGNSSKSLIATTIGAYTSRTGLERGRVARSRLVIHSVSSYFYKYFNTYSGNGEKTNRHKAKLTSNVFNIKIKVNVEECFGDISLSNQFSSVVFGKDATTKLTTSFVLNHQESVSVPSSYISSSSAVYALSVSASASGGAYGKDGVAASYTIGTDGLNLKTVPYRSVVEGNSDSDYAVNGGRSLNAKAYTSGSSLEISPEFRVGDNEIITTVNADNEYSLYANGNIIDNYETSYIVERSFVGIGFTELNNLAIQHIHGKAVGIKSFKAWVDGMPEPPDETGFGVFNKDNIDFYYRDKYHQRIRDQITNDVIGFSYDPLA